MKNKFHGVFSLALIGISMAGACGVLFAKSKPLGILYGAVVICAAMVVLYAYCAKCLCRLDACGHAFPGKLTRFLPRRKAEPYTGIDLGATALALGVMFLFPQYWLWQNKMMLVLFWCLAFVALAEILSFVCRKCKNSNCLINPISK